MLALMRINIPHLVNLPARSPLRVNSRTDEIQKWFPVLMEQISG